MRSRTGSKLPGIAVMCIVSIAASVVHAADSRQFSFAYDQPTTTAYGIAANIFDAKLKELSGGKMSINQFPGAQLGQEPQMLQKMRAGDIDFVITSTANASTLAPQAGVFSLHFIFRDQQHLAKALADPAIAAEFRAMVKDQVQGAQVLGLLTMGMRNMYSKKEVKNIDDIKGQKVRVQAAADEVSKTEPALALKLEKDSADKLKTIGVKVVENVDKSGFIKAAQPIQDQLATELGPHAVKLLKLVREVK